MTEIIFVRGEIFSCKSAGLTLPNLSTGSFVTVQPSFSIAAQEFNTALCSTPEVIMFGRSFRWASTEDFIAQLSLSVPPDVKTISCGEALMQAAISSRASRKIFFSGRESLYADDGLA